MTLKNSNRSGSPLTLCLILMLSIAFLAPLYHSHDYTGDYHQEYSDDHVFLHHGSGQETLSTSQSRNDSHLHIKKDIGRADRHQHFKDKSLRPDLSAETASAVFTEHLTCSRAKLSHALMCRYNSSLFPSGLSPPAV